MYLNSKTDLYKQQLIKNANIFSSSAKKYLPKLIEKLTQSDKPFNLLSAINSKDVPRAGIDAIKNLNLNHLGLSAAGGGGLNVGMNAALSGENGYDLSKGIRDFSIGGFLGAGGFTGAKGAKGLSDIIKKRYGSIKDLSSVGIKPEFVTKAQDAAESFSPQKDLSSLEAIKSKFKETFSGSNRKAVVGLLSNQDAGQGVMGPYALSRMKDLGMDSIDAGKVLNTNVVRVLNNDLMQKKFVESGIKNISGNVESNIIKAISPEEQKYFDALKQNILGEKKYKKLVDSLVIDPTQKGKIYSSLQSKLDNLDFDEQEMLSFLPGVLKKDLKSIGTNPERFKDYIWWKSMNPDEKIRGLYAHPSYIDPRKTINGIKWSPIDNFNLDLTKGDKIPVNWIS